MKINFLEMSTKDKIKSNNFNSKSDPRSRDEHILKQIKRALSNCHGPEFLQLTTQLATPQAKIQALEAAAKAKFITPEILDSAIVGFLEKLKSIGMFLILNIFN